MGCYVDKKGQPKDACVISRDYSTPNNYYVFNHVDIEISYHDGQQEDWGKYLHGVQGGRIVSVKLQPKSIMHTPEEVNGGKCSTDPSKKPLNFAGEGSVDVDITYSYSVVFK